MKPFKVLCINSANKPDGIPTSKWITKGQEYTVIEVSKMRIQGNLLGYKLAEIDLDSCFPYQYFAANRFGIIVKYNVEDTWVEEKLEKIMREAEKEAVEFPEAV
jgi:hypothetical protein